MQLLKKKVLKIAKRGLSEFCFCLLVVLFCFELGMKSSKEEYSGTPLIRPHSGRENVAVITGWSD